MEYAGQQFTGNLIHIGDHQQQSLRSSKGRGQGTGLQGSVNGTGRTGFRLHFLQLDRFSENVLSSACCPLIHILSHSGRRRNGINCSHFAEHVSDVCGSIVPITDNELLCFGHLSILLTVKKSFNYSTFLQQARTASSKTPHDQSGTSLRRAISSISQAYHSSCPFAPFPEVPGGLPTLKESRLSIKQSALRL